MRIMGNEDGMGSLNKGSLMEIGPALPADLVEPVRESRHTLPALDVKVLASASQGPIEPPPAKPEKKRGGLGRLLFLAFAAVVLGAAAFYAYDWWSNGRKFCRNW